jgi:hypothetical protein
MAKLSVAKGATSVLVRVFLQDSSSTTGAGLTGLAYNTAGLTCYRARDDDGNAGGTAVTLATATLGTWATGGFKEKDSTNMPGWYEFGIPNAALASGSRSVDFHFKGATNLAPCPLEIELTGVDNQDGVHGGMSAIPNTAVTTNASLLTSGTGTDQLSVTSGRVDVGKALGTAVTLDANNVLNVSSKYWAGTAITATSLPVATAAGAANGLLIAGSNAATTFATLTSTGAFTTGGFSAGAITCTTVTASGAVAFQSTFAVTTSTNLAALSCSTFASSGTVTFNAFAVTNNLTVSGNWLTTGTTTWTGAAAFSAGLACNITGNLLGTVSTLTTYTGDTPQSGDAFARIGATGSGLTSLAPAATALSTAQWTAARAGYLDNVGVAMTEAYAANGAAPTMVQMLYMLYSAVTQVSQAGTVLTSVKLDGATTAMSWTLNNATSPTSRVRAS